MAKRSVQNNYSVYKHTSPSGKVYVGITSLKVQKRWNKGRGYLKCPIFHRAIIKYGWDNIIHEVIATNLSYEEACFLEIKLIDYYKRLGISYNSADGGNSNAGYKATDKQREHARNIWKGKKIPKSVVEASSRSRTGIKQTEATKSKKSKSLQKHYAKRVYKLDKLGNLLKIYNNLEEAAIDNKAERKQIAQCCNKGALVFRSYYYLYEEEYTKYGITKRKLGQNKPIIMYNEMGEVARFNDSHFASKALGLKLSAIRDACTKGHKLMGHLFKYLY